MKRSLRLVAKGDHNIMVAVHYMIVFSQLYLMIFNFLNFEKRKTIWRINLLTIFGLLIFDVFRYYQFEVIIHHADTILYIGLAFIVMMYAMQKIRTLLLLILTQLFISFVSMVAASFFFTLLSIPISSLVTNPINSIIGAILGLVLLFSLCYWAKFLGLTLDVSLLTKKDLFIITISILFLGFSISNVLLLANYLNETVFGNFLNFFAMLGGIIVVYVSLIMISRNNHIKKIENRSRLQSLNSRRQKQHYEILKQQNKEIQKFKHDIRKQLKVLYRLLMQEKYDDAYERIESLIGTYEEIEDIVEIKTGSDVIDANLYFLQRERGYKNINVEWTGWFENRIEMTNEDIIALFVNLIENAFEATSKSLNDSYVKIFVDEDDKDTYIKVQNSYNGEIAFYNRKYKTTKQNKSEHGLGLVIVKEVVEKYGGNIKISHGEYEFVVEIVIPCGK